MICVCVAYYIRDVERCERMYLTRVGSMECRRGGVCMQYGMLCMSGRGVAMYTCRYYYD